MRYKFRNLLSLVLVIAVMLSTIAIMPVSASVSASGTIATDTAYATLITDFTKDGRLLIGDGVTTTPVYANNRNTFGTASLDSFLTALSNDSTDKTVGLDTVSVVERTDDANKIAFNTDGLFPTLADAAEGTHYDSQMSWVATTNYTLSGKYLKGVAVVATNHTTGVNGELDPSIRFQGVYTTLKSSDNETVTSSKLRTYHKSESGSLFVAGTESSSSTAYNINYFVSYNNDVAPIPVNQYTIKGDTENETAALHIFGIYEIEYSFDELTTVMTSVINAAYADNTTTDNVKESIRDTLESAESRGYDIEANLGTTVYEKYRVLCPMALTGLSVASTHTELLPASGSLSLSAMLPVTGISTYPQATVKYYLNGASEESAVVTSIGTYTVKTVISSAGYASKEFTTTLTIEGQITDKSYATVADITKSGRLLIKDNVATTPIYGNNRNGFGIASLDSVISAVNNAKENKTIGTKTTDVIEKTFGGNQILFDVNGLFPTLQDGANGNHTDSHINFAQKETFTLSGKYLKGVALISNNHSHYQQRWSGKLLSANKGNVPATGDIRLNSYHYTQTEDVFVEGKTTTTEGVVGTDAYNIHYSAIFNDASNPIPVSGFELDLSEATGTYSAMHIFGLYEIEYGFAELTSVMTNVINEEYADLANVDQTTIEAIDRTIKSAQERGYDPETALGIAVYNKYLEICPQDVNTGTLTLTSSVPADGAQDISVNDNEIVLTFSNYIETINLQANLQIKVNGETFRAYSVSTYANRGTITFDAPFGESKTIEVTLKGTLQDKYSNALGSDVVITFNTQIPAIAVTAVEPETAPIPTVDKVIKFTFSTEIVDDGNMASHFVIKRNGTPISEADYTVSVEGKVATVTLNDEFGTNNTYSYEISGVKDIYDQVLTTPHTGSFVSDTVAFSGVASLPVVTAGKVDSRLDTIRFEFTTPVTVEAFKNNFTLIKNTNVMDETQYQIATENYDRVVIVTLNDGFGYGASYEYTVSSVLQDKYGQTIASAITDAFSTDISNATLKTLIDVDFEDPVEAATELSMWVPDVAPQNRPIITEDPLDATNTVLQLTSDLYEGTDVIYTRAIADSAYTPGTKIEITFDYMWGLSSNNNENGYVGTLVSPEASSGRKYYSWYLAGNSNLRLMDTASSLGASATRLDLATTAYNTKWTTVRTIIDPETSTIQYLVGSALNSSTRYISTTLDGSIASLVTKMYKGQSTGDGSDGINLTTYIDNIKVDVVPEFTILEPSTGALSAVDPKGSINVNFSMNVKNATDKIKLYKNGVEILNNYSFELLNDGASARIDIDGDLEYNTYYTLKVLKGTETVSRGNLTKDVEVTVKTAKAEGANVIDNASITSQTSTSATVTYQVENLSASQQTVYVFVAAYSANDVLLGTNKVKVDNIPASSTTVADTLTISGMPSGQLDYIKVFTFGTDLSPMHLPIILR